MISFAILLRKSASDCDEKSRLRPVNGLILLNLGEIALKVIMDSDLQNGSKYSNKYNYCCKRCKCRKNYGKNFSR